MKWSVVALVSSLLSAFLTVGLYRAMEEPRQVVVSNPYPALPTGFHSESSARPGGPAYPATPPTDFILAADRVTPAVVNIRSVKESEYRFLGFEEETSTGSGVLLSSDGYIVTNHHVISQGDRIDVTLSDRRTFPAQLVGTDPSTDIALIRIQTEDDLPFVGFANSDSLRVGEWVVAVGNPFNLESTVTAGIVSAKGRSINILEDAYRVEAFIQTDAVINPGNSGGALVNTRGDLVGINTAIVTKSGKYEGYSFAIPANLVRKVVTDLREHGSVQRGVLGINVDDLGQEQARDAGIPPGNGVLISRVNPGSAAFDAGLRRGDIILSIGDHQIHSIPELQEQVAQARPGQTLRIAYNRNGKNRDASVTLQQIREVSLTIDPRSESLYAETGIGLRTLNPEEVSRFGKAGAVVETVDPGSKGGQVNLEPGFLIETVNGTRVRSLTECLDMLERRGRIVLEGRYTEYPGEFKYIFLR